MEEVSLAAVCEAHLWCPATLLPTRPSRLRNLQVSCTENNTSVLFTVGDDNMEINTG